MHSHMERRKKKKDRNVVAWLKQKDTQILSTFSPNSSGPHQNSSLFLSKPNTQKYHFLSPISHSLSNLPNQTHS